MSRTTSCPPSRPSGAHRNWAGNVWFSATALRRPRSLDELQGLVAGSPKVHALGTAHSFSDAADTEGVLVALDEMPSVLEIDAASSSVRVSAGTRFSALGSFLQREGLALTNLGSLPHIGVAGACATGTHGSGDANACLAAQVSSLEIVRANGELEVIDASSPGDELAGSVVACGALGVVHSLSLATVPSFQLRQTVYEDLAFDTVAGALDELLASAYSVSVFVDWAALRASQVWLKERVGPDLPPPRASLLGARAADGARHPVPGQPAQSCTPQLGAPGPWNERLPHFRAEAAPSAAGNELQSEYLVERSLAPRALRALARRRDAFAHLVQVGELRSVAADRLWCSPSAERDSVAIHFTWQNDPAAVASALPAVEAALTPLGARPHWGKLFAMTPAEVEESYGGRLSLFARLAEARDPGAKFVNRFISTYLVRDAE